MIAKSSPNRKITSDFFKSNRIALALLIAVFSSYALPTNSQEREDPLSTNILAPEKNKLDTPLKEGELIGEAVSSDDGKSITVSFQSNSERALFVDGDNARLMAQFKVTQNRKEHSKVTHNDENLPKQLNEIISAPAKVNIPGDSAFVLGSIASIGSGPLSFDLNKSKNSPAHLYYGKDQARRELAGLIFGNRIIFPGERSAGKIFLKSKTDSDAALKPSIIFQIKSYPDQKTIGTIALPIK
ncbi:MAG: hypothetical protein J0M35_15710 [Candidatus Obscuribacter phosphatis]|uniref:Uncharacterized protein n=1 Tax=Candidatus Obscuribacter phosphatis TaxID=1906157 RepID=A0A8J7TP97_9BACT|nr:hypothetical protein [Candidatus Obscuribacter phosphatis]